MDHIETKILNSYTIQEAAQNMVFAARLMLYVYFYGKGAFKIHLEGLIFSD